jgi:hypothetical protein
MGGSKGLAQAAFCFNAGFCWRSVRTQCYAMSAEKIKESSYSMSASGMTLAIDIISGLQFLAWGLSCLENDAIRVGEKGAFYYNLKPNNSLKIGMHIC